VSWFTGFLAVGKQCHLLYVTARVNTGSTWLVFIISWHCTSNAAPLMFFYLQRPCLSFMSTPYLMIVTHDTHNDPFVPLHLTSSGGRRTQGRVPDLGPCHLCQRSAVRPHILLRAERVDWVRHSPQVGGWHHRCITTGASSLSMCQEA
jgi:hypothetical protein